MNNNHREQLPCFSIHCDGCGRKIEIPIRDRAYVDDVLEESGWYKGRNKEWYCGFCEEE